MPNVTERVKELVNRIYQAGIDERFDDANEAEHELLAMIRPTPASVVQRPTPEPVVWRFKRPDGRWEYDEGVGPPKIVGGIEAWEAKGWIFEALYNDKEVGE